MRPAALVVPRQSRKRVFRRQVCIQARPTSADAKQWIALGNRYFDTHQRDKAIKTWKRVIEIAPTTVQAAKAHAYIERVNPMAKPQ